MERSGLLSELYSSTATWAASKGRPDGAAGEILREIESPERCPNWVETARGVRGCPKSALPKFTNYFEILVSAAGLEPATHALKA